jgi:hypothetical protein
MEPYERSELGVVGEGTLAVSPLQVRLASKLPSLPILSPEGEEYHRRNAGPNSSILSIQI